MRTLRGRLILSHILPLLLVIPLAGIALAYSIETQVVLSEISKKLTERANLIAEVLKVQPDVWNETDQAQEFISGIGYLVEGQVFLLRPNGVLIATNDPQSIDLPGQPSHLEGLETAIAGDPSIIVRYGWFTYRAQVLIPVIDARQELIGIVGATQTLEGIVSRIGQLRGFILITLLVELVLGSLIGYLLARRLARPIERAAAGVIDIAEGQEIQPVPIDGPDEIRRLSSAVNILSERLRILEETRRRSLANIVHELGRPLGAIQSAVHVLLQGAEDDPDVRHELLQGVDGEIKRMRPLLDDLAQLHGQVTGSLKLDRQQTSLSDWLPTVLLPWRAAALEKSINWQAEIPPHLPTLSLDPERMGQVIGNLLSNAIKYTSKGGSVTATAGSDEAEAWIQVSDTGPGIVIEEQGRVFEPFYRSQQERRFPQGLGLGLTIARDIVEAHDGRLVLTSVPGDGSRFTIHLPIANEK